MNLKIVLLVGASGFIGTLLRFACVRIAGRLFPSFPYGTMFVNVIGAFAAGFVCVMGREFFQEYKEYLPVVLIGFLGAFTTFSTFALESGNFLADGEYGKFAVNVFVQNVTGIGAAILGMYVSRLIFRAA